MVEQGVPPDFENVKDRADVDWQLMLYTGQKLLKDVRDAAVKPSLIIVHLLSLREINEMYSRELTDKMLGAIRDFLRACAEGAELYRLGGGKFCLSVVNGQADGLEKTAGLMRERFDEAWELGENGETARVYCGAEMVILNAEFIRFNTDPLLNVIERAAFFTRKQNKGVLYYNSKMNRSNIRSQRFDYSLKNSVYGGMKGFNVYYQPIADPMTGIWCGVEALCRWSDPESGNVPADVFISAAERLGLIDDLGLWVLETAVRKCKEWELDKIEDFILEVNISPVQLTEPRLAERIVSILDEYGFPCLKLCFEITDGAQFVFNGETVALMERLKKRNITFALDDFGAGYSAFSDLSKLPVDVVKIEHNFTSNILTDNHLRHMFKAISELAHTANLQVVAEGVESAEQMRVLLENGADLLQGYLISKPVPPEEMARLLEHFKKPGEAYKFLSRKIDVSKARTFDDEFFFTSSLNKISNKCIHILLCEKDINTALRKTLEIVGLHMKVSRSYIFQRNANLLFDNTHEWCAEGITPFKNELVDLPVTESTRRFMAAQGSVVSSNLKDLPDELYEVLDWQGVKAILLIPLWERDTVTGLVGFDDCRENRKWRPEEVLFLQSFSLIIASVMNRLRKSDELARLNETFERRASLVDAINSILERLALADQANFEEAISASIERLAAAVGVQRVSVLRCMQYDRHETRARMLLYWNAKNHGTVDRTNQFLPDYPAIQQWSGELQSDVRINRRFSDMNEDEQDYMLLIGGKSALMIPTFIRGVYWGCMAFVDMENERLFDEDIMDIMRSVTKIIINAIIREDVETQLTNESSYNRELINTLSKRERMLGALNQTAVSFLAQSPRTFRDQLYIGMELMSGYADLNHICIWKREEVYDFPRYTLYRKWTSKSGSPQATMDEGGIFPFGPFSDWDIIFKHNGYINCMNWELHDSKQRILAQYGINALLVFPVFTQNSLWGLVSFANSGEILFKKDEVDILRHASLMLGSVIIRDEEAAKAREAETRIKLMLNATPLSCQLWDKDSRLIDCNEEAYKLFGLGSKEELEAKTADFTPELQPDGSSSVDAWLKNLRKAFNGGVVIYDWMFRLPDGKPLPTEVTLKRVAYKDGYIVAGYTRDLRRLKLLEEEAGKIYYDPLTGIYNRRFLDENLLRIIKTLSRSNGTLSLMIVDIDRFKQYNDAYGHIQGDECLRMVAESLNESVTRTDDFVARYGGEEFAVVLPNTDAEGAEIIANRMLESVREKKFAHRESDVLDVVSVSIGIITGRVTASHTEQDFIHGADIMLYEAKHGGRNGYRKGNL